MKSKPPRSAESLAEFQEGFFCQLSAQSVDFCIFGSFCDLLIRIKDKKYTCAYSTGSAAMLSEEHTDITETQHLQRFRCQEDEGIEALSALAF